MIENVSRTTWVYTRVVFLRGEMSRRERRWCKQKGDWAEHE